MDEETSSSMALPVELLGEVREIYLIRNYTEYSFSLRLQSKLSVLSGCTWDI